MMTQLNAGLCRTVLIDNALLLDVEKLTTK